jgi:hypothetical protein
MELTPEERHQIYLEEKAKQPMQKALKVVFIVVLAMFAYVTYTAYMTGMEYQCVQGRLDNAANGSVGVATGPGRNAQISNPATTPTTSARPASDLVNDRSEEGIRQNILAVDKAITYEQLKKDASHYHGEPWAFSGQVVQIQEGEGRTTALVSLDSWGSKTMYVRANFTTQFVEKAQVYVVGYLAGNYSYTSVAGWNLTVPAIEARAILKPSEAARIRAGKPPSKK